MRIVIDDETRMVLGTIAGTMAAGEGQSIAEIPSFDTALIGRAIARETAEGWIVNPVEPPAPTPEEIRAALKTYTADRRWQIEQGGAVWNGWPIHTDDRSQGKYLSELQAISLGVRVDDDPWKFADGEFRPVSNADFPQLAIAARDHVRTVFGIEAAVLAEIEGGTITTRTEIDAAFA